MASSNIKLFDENKGNMLTDTEFNISTQRLNGLQTGVASSQLQNKAMYQASLVAYAIAQIMLQNGLNANDTDAVSAFVANLSSTMLQKVHDVATTEEAQAGVAIGKWMSPALVKAAIDTLAAKAQNILSDETKALFGLGSSAVPDDVLSLINTLIGNLQSSVAIRAKIQTGSYVGTGRYGDANPCSLTFNFEPEFVFVFKYNATLLPFYAYNSSGTCTECMIWLNKSNSCMENTGANMSSFDESTNTLSWYESYSVAEYKKEQMQLNQSGATYKYIAIG